jgi:hypothetical protein
MKNDILIILPCCWIDEKEELDLSNITFSKNSINLTQYGHIIDLKSIYKISAVLIALIGLVFAEYFITANKVVEITAQKDNIFIKNGLKSTMFENRSILKKYKSIHSKQTKLREVSSIIISSRLKSNELLKQVSYKNSTYSVDFDFLSSTSRKSIISKLKTKKIKTTSKNKTNLEMKL